MLNMTRFAKMVILFCTFSVTGNAVSFLNAQDGRQKIYEVTSQKDKRVVIPFELINNLIVIEAQINDSGPLKFILDSGAGRNIITNLHDEDLTLNNVNTVAVAGLGEGNTLEAFQSFENSIRIGDRIQGQNAEVLILKEDVIQLSTFMGTEVNGILGYDFFQSFAVEVHYRRKELRIYEPEPFRNKFEELPGHRKWYSFPITVEDKKSYIIADYKHSERDSYIPLLLLLDTGASNSFSLYESTDEDITVPANTISAIIGTGLSGRVTGELGRVKSMKIDEFIFHEPVVSFPDSISVRRVLKAENRKGSIGGDIFRRFKTIFHYQNEQLYLRKNRDFGEDFNYNASGIVVSTPVPNMPYFVVAYVREESPAYYAGIQEGDIITEINGEKAYQLSLNDFINYFQNKKSNSLRLRIQRDTISHYIRFNMNNVLVPDS